MDYKFCHNCGALLNSPQDHFCFACGSQQKMPRVVVKETKPAIPKKRGPIAAFFLTLLQCFGYYGFYFGVENVVSFIAALIIGVSLTFSQDYENAFNAEFSKAYMIITIADAIFIIFAYFLFHLVRKKNFAKEIKLKGINVGSFIGALMLGFAAQFIITGTVNFIYELAPDLMVYSQSDSYETLFSGASIPMQIIAIGIFGPILEEVLFRGIIHRKLRKVLPKWAAIVLSSILFAAAHMNLEQFFYVTPLAIVMAYAYEYFDSILASVAIHIGFNISSFLVTECFDEVSAFGFYVFCFGCIGLFLAVFAFVFLRKKEAILNETL